MTTKYQRNLLNRQVEMILFFGYALLLDMRDDILSGFIGLVVKIQFFFDVITSKMRGKTLWNRSFILKQYK